ncbi:MAG: RND transporter [Gammaproteobacteria bacterium]|nr:RND transporter [Gammaproteobacteria bacterium]PCH62387.1 MAG: RND transporter [Gammaproteobacteria bacterium]
MKWLDKIPLPILAIVTLPLALAPFKPPHVYEKLQMLFAGNLSNPTDIFDLLLHGIPAIIFIVKLVRMLQQRLVRASKE